MQQHPSAVTTSSDGTIQLARQTIQLTQRFDHPLPLTDTLQCQAESNALAWEIGTKVVAYVFSTFVTSMTLRDTLHHQPRDSKVFATSFSLAVQSLETLL